MIDTESISIFCLTETKINCANFTPLGLTIHDKQRTGKPEQEKGGGLMLGYITDEKIRLEKVETESEDILIVEEKYIRKK